MPLVCSQVIPLVMPPAEASPDILNILKALTGNSWGMEKELLKTTYSAIGKYSKLIWTPTLSDTNWSELQIAKNAALPTVTGCTKMTDIGHLHTETKEVYVNDHCEMLLRQFLLGTTRQGHPNNRDITRIPKRLMKDTLASRFKEDLQALASARITNDSINYKGGLNRVKDNKDLNIFCKICCFPFEILCC